MKNKVVFVCLISLSVIIITSCNFYYRMRLGIKNPKTENINSIKASFKKHFKTAPDNIFIAKDSACYMELFKLKSTLKTQLYNKDGFEIKMQDSGYCYVKAGDFIKNLDSGSQYKLDTTKLLSEILKLIRPINQDQKVDLTGYDFVFVNSWAVFVGRGNKNLYDVYLEMSKKDLKTYYIFVNFDVIEEWGNISLKMEK